jgi:pyoverdine/dityrosine biosynthesis protein Dit1
VARSTRDDETASRERDILDVVFRFRRLASPPGPCAARPCDECYRPHEGKVAGCVGAGEPVRLIVPGFPAKSPNPAKVLGPLPDRAERLSLEFLQSCCDEIGRHYRPGARVTICSDGHVFGGAVGVTDEEVSCYRRELEAIIEGCGFSSIGLYSLHDAFGSKTFQEMRTELLAAYAEPLPRLRARIRQEVNLRRQFNGVHRFLLEDEAAMHPLASRNRLSEDCKARAHEVIQRSNAWSRLLSETFPGALRLSIHPQPSHSPKIGFHLVSTRDNWLTPWHGVALELRDGMLLAKRHQAERLNATLVRQGSRPSHFIAPHIRLAEVSAWQSSTSSTAA